MARQGEALNNKEDDHPMIQIGDTHWVNPAHVTRGGDGCAEEPA